ncbi:hypothetical protein AB0G15_30165 [Streptosporangium sp. NPDC023825]|uniref:hypothetical protein n=1 Tax=Streptosporangium sp. NPDC023825 TaxID=3154909 RepID=UPI0034240CAD
MTSRNTRPRQPLAPGRPVLGLPVLAVIGLALLAAPRVVLHDLDVIHEGTFVNALFVFVPPVVWIAVALWKRVPNPFLTLLVVGLFHGVILAAGHQLLWNSAFGGDPPALGGNLSDLDAATQSAILRLFAAISSVFTGVIVGAITGLVAWGLGRVVPPGSRTP